MRIIGAAIGLVAFAAVASTSSSANPPQLTQSAPATDCDTYAANPLDPGRVAHGIPIDKINPDLAIPACESAVREYPDSSRLNYQLGRAYLKINDFSSALIRYQRAANQGYLAAQFNIGDLYLKGWGVAQSYAEAMKWFRTAADQGLAMAQSSLGALYANGQGVQKNYPEAMKWFRKAADQGDASAERNLAQMYVNGDGVPQDYAEAAKWFRKAAYQSDALAQASFGLLYASGQGVPQDYAEAVK